MTITVDPVTSWDQAKEALRTNLPAFEERPQQDVMARAVERALADERHLMAEAGTGTGKSLAYLIPSILSGQRVVVATATKALQTQIARKDLPFLEENLGVPFRWAVLKGRSNYLCRNRAALVDSSEVPCLRSLLEVASAEGFSGEREDFPFEIGHKEWSLVCSDADSCRDLKCSQVGGCFAHDARERAREANVVVVNHAVLFADILLGIMTSGAFNMLGDYGAVVLDEAHEAEEYCSSALGTEISEGSVRSLLAEVRSYGRNFLPQAEQDRLYDAGAAVDAALQGLWGFLREVLGKATRLRIRGANLVEGEEQWVGMAVALEEYAKSVAAMDLNDVSTADINKARNRKRTLCARSRNLADRFAAVVTEDWSQSVRWVETEFSPRFGDRLVLKAQPITVADWLRENLHEGRTVISVSATLKIQGDFRFMASRLGCDRFDEVDVGTPFDYQSQALTYIPNDLPEPAGRTRAAWEGQAVARMRDLVTFSGGHALITFTSTKAMRAAFDAIAPWLDQECMMQGQATNRVLIERFRENPSSVLFATRSFMTGVDFPGDCLQLMIIDKLPFPVPDDPVVEARCDLIKMRGGNDFGEYTIPVMILVLKQAFGRLIRTGSDTGVFACLDPRLLSKGYGRGIMRSLPDAPVVSDLAYVRSFFS